MMKKNQKSGRPGIWSGLLSFIFRDEKRLQRDRKVLDDCRLLLLQARFPPVLPAPLELPLRNLSRSCAALSECLGEVYGPAKKIIPDLERVVFGITRLAGSRPQEPWSAQTSLLYIEAVSLNSDLEALLRNREQEKRELQPLREMELSAGIRDKALALRREGHSLAPGLRSHIENICEAAEQMLRKVEQNPGSRTRILRFLNKYLGAATVVLEDFLLLRQGGEAGANPMEGMEERMGDLLSKMEAAFSAEYQALLRHEVLHFSAELKALDTVLKMDGY